MICATVYRSFYRLFVTALQSVTNIFVKFTSLRASIIAHRVDFYHKSRIYSLVLFLYWISINKFCLFYLKDKNRSAKNIYAKM